MGKRSVRVTFEDDQFEAIRQLALADKVSFSEQVRLLCEWGIESANLPQTKGLYEKRRGVERARDG
jgi:hypothetical protein